MVFQAINEQYGFGIDTSVAATSNYMAWKEGIDASVAGDMDVTIAAGTLLYKGETITHAGAVVSVTTAHATLVRRDMIVFNGTTFEVIAGVPEDDTASIAKPANIDTDENIACYLVEVRAAVSEIIAGDIKDYRIRGLFFDDDTLENIDGVVQVKDTVINSLSPIGAIIAWMKNLVSSNIYSYLTEYSTPYDTQGWFTAHSFTGQDLIDVGVTEGEDFAWFTDIKKAIAAEGGGSAGSVKLVIGGVDYITIGPIITAGIYETHQTDVSTTWDNTTTFSIQAYGDARNLAGGETYTKNNIFAYSSVVLPANWVQCDGQVLSDAGSILDGETIPDLNGEGRFLRGSSISGVLQADDIKSHAHTSRYGSGYEYASSSHFNVASSKQGSSTNFAGSSIGGAETRPINMSVVWIMRVK